MPKTIENRPSDHSSSEQIFNEAKRPYEKALNDCGYQTTLNFNPTREHIGVKNRKRNIIWFNPPFNKNVVSNVGKNFLKLIDKHFPKHHKLHKIFDRNTIKVSYSCTKNIKSIIQSHNKAILHQKENDIEKPCNSRVKGSYPLNDKCLVERSIYEATVTCKDDPLYGQKVYIGLAESLFKQRFGTHKISFNHEKYEKETELSKEI